MLLNYQAATESQAATYPGYPGKRRREINLFSSLVSYYVTQCLLVRVWLTGVISYVHTGMIELQLQKCWTIAPFEYRLAVAIYQLRSLSSQ